MNSASRAPADSVDNLINGFDRALKTLTGGRSAARENPAQQIDEAELTLSLIHI